jgi:hypothetical protein
MAYIITAHGMFGRYAMFSFGVSLDPRGCRGTWKKHCRVFEIFDLEQFSQDAAAPDEGFAGKREFEMSPQVQ